MRYSRNILIILSFLFLVAFSYSAYYSNIHNREQNQRPIAKGERGETTKGEIEASDVWSGAYPLESEDFMLKGIKLGDSLKSVLDKLGESKLKKQTKDGISYNYGDIEVILNAENTVVNILTDKNSTATRRNIHPGSSLEKVKAKYGEAFKEIKANVLEYYEYKLTVNPSKHYALRFAVEAGTNQVSYIGICVLNAAEAEEKRVKTVKYRFDAKVNKLVLTDNDLKLNMGDKLLLVQEGSTTQVGLASNSDSDYNKLFTVFNNSSTSGDITLVAKAPGRNSILLWVPHDAPAAAELMVTVRGE